MGFLYFIVSFLTTHKNFFNEKFKKKKQTFSKMARAAAAKKTVSRRRANRTRFNTFINRVNKNAKKGLTLSSKSVKILNSFVHDMFDKIAPQAAALARANKKSTIRAAEVQLPS